jgi:hypothetical protein
VESHGQSTLLVLCNKHIAHHREQKLLDETAELNVDKEFEQILLVVQQLAMKPDRQQIVIFRQNLQPLQLGDLRQGSARDDLL